LSSMAAMVRGKTKRTTIPGDTDARPADLVDRVFKAVAPNLLWVADLTYIRLPAGFCYLAAILDAFSRRVVGWSLSRHIDGDLAVAALEQALAGRQPRAGWIHHSDRGVQYACRDYVERLEAALENMNQGLAMIDEDERVRVINNRAIELLGLPAHLLVNLRSGRPDRRSLAERTLRDALLALPSRPAACELIDRRLLILVRGGIIIRVWWFAALRAVTNARGKAIAAPLRPRGSTLVQQPS